MDWKPPERVLWKLPSLPWPLSARGEEGALFSHFLGGARALCSPYNLPACLQILSLSDSPQMTELVLLDFVEESSWLDKAEGNLAALT